MKIGIVTFYRVANYGAMLQAYALRRFLESMGHEVVFVSHPRLVSSRIPLWKCFVSRHLKGVVIKLKRYVRHSMTEFAASYPQTKFCQTMAEVREATADCDAFVVGSDQMWKPLWCSGAHLPLVMLDFADIGKPRIAYAVSFGTTVWCEDQGAELAGELLRKFSRISVREESGVKLVNELSGRSDAVCLLDPTLLHSADFYREIISSGNASVPRRARPTIFRYVLDEWDDPETTQKAFEFVRGKLGFPDVDSDRIAVCGFLGPLCKLLGVTAKVSVPLWLAKIAASDFVFTNSFHGTVFALLFHKPFVTLLLRGGMSGMNERVLSLLKKLGLESRAAYADDVASLELALATPIDWEKVEVARMGSAEESVAFLQESLRNEHGVQIIC